jgi:phosphoserine phosphatase
LAYELAQVQSLDLAATYAYGDHHSYRQLLASVGHPFAVNPHPVLRREARRRGWPLLKF